MLGSEQVFCTACGTINETATAHMAEMAGSIANLGIELNRKQGQINRLRKQQKEERPPEYDDAMEVAVYWRDEVRPTAIELNGPRLQNTIDRLKHGYSKEDLKLACWGYRCRPNIKDGKRVRRNQGGRRYDDLELICRDAKHVEDGMDIAMEERLHDQGLLDDHASRYVADLCDCGHPRADHALFRFHGHEGCLRQDEHCSCEAFDDIHLRAEMFRRAQGTLM